MAEAQAVSAPKKKTKTGALAIVLALVLGAGGTFLWLHSSSSTNAGDNSAAAAATIPLETFVVNLTGSNQRTYLRVGIALALSHPLSSRREEAIPMPLVQDTILSVLSAAQPEQLLQAEGKRQLRAEILRALQERAPQLGVQDVYFTEFLVQM